MQRQFVEQNKCLEKKLGDLDSKWSARLAGINQRASDYTDSWDKRIQEAERRSDERFTVVEKVAGSLEEWRPGVDGTLDDIRLEVRKLTKLCDRSTLKQSSSAPGLIAVPPSAAPRPFADLVATRPSGHCDDLHPREVGFGVVTTLHPPPVKGTFLGSSSTAEHLFHGPLFEANLTHHASSSHLPMGHLPKLHFSQFDGDNPRLWISWVEMYFDMYSVDPSLWLKVASMYCTGPASHWIQSIDR